MINFIIGVFVGAILTVAGLVMWAVWGEDEGDEPPWL